MRCGVTQARAIWSIALPAMATNVATALIGVADVWVIGQLGDAAAQGAVEVGARLLMTLLVVFNFLKTATTGLTAQATGGGDAVAVAATLLRALGFALAIGLVLLLLKPLVVPVGLDLLAAEGAVREQAATYVDIRYWAAPFWLLSAALTGWLVGLRRVRTVLVVEIFINLVHVGLDVLLVLWLGMGIEGVAATTLASEALKFGLLLAVLRPSLAPAALAASARSPEVWRAGALLALLRVNRDLFLRTLLLMAAFLLLTRRGAEQGAVTLAANAILLQMFMLSALLLDAFENAAQVLCGEAVGAREHDRFLFVMKLTLWRGGVVALALSTLFAAAGTPIVSSFSTDAAVVAAATAFSDWLLVIPLAGVVSFVFDGVFIGATWTRAMLLTMAAAVAVDIVALELAAPLGNHGLWLAFTLFLAARALAQAALLPSLARRTFAPIVATD
jgi:MATE family multidrug resistance protein